MSPTPKGYRHREIQGRRLHPETLMMSYGYDPRLSEGSVKCPIFQTSTFAFRTAEDGKSFFEVAYGLREKGPAEDPGLIYSRLNNPDLEILQDRLCLWDEAESGLVFSSGMAAISTTMLSFLRPGDVILCSEPVYGGTEFLVEHILPQFGIQRVWFGSGTMPVTLDQAVAQGRTLGRIGMICLETPANPTNGLVNIADCARVARDLAAAGGHRPLVAVDNTFLGPLWQHPLQHGADLVLYSLTKYAGGHSDLIAGACLGPEALIATVRGMRTILGTISDPHTGWLLMRSLETLKL
ncbi:MAG: PLP-dependent transferase, partial [Vicinamibacterales bacterium]|nr:PLP-dependent transferase [Vicinamibacterales bacterium]